MNIKYNLARVFISMIALVAIFQVQPAFAQTSGTTCPAGYICTPVTNPGQTLATTSDASAAVTGSATLRLVYNTAAKTNMLTATFNVSVYGGTKGVDIYTSGAPGVSFVNSQNGNQNNSLNSQSSTLAPANSSVTTATDDNGNSVYVVSPGQVATFKVTSSVNPNQLFAGTYTASLISLYSTTGNVATNGFSLTLKPNSTNAVTVVGEISPYITGFQNYPSTNYFNVGQTITITGQRLTGSYAVFDNATSSGIYALSVSQNGTVGSVTLPSSVINGFHTIYVFNTTGKSNVEGFQVGPQSGGITGLTATISLDASNPLASTILATNSTQGQYLNLPVLVFDVSAQNGNLELSDLNAQISTSGNGQVNAAYLYQGSTLIDSATVSNGIARFFDLPLAANIPSSITIPQNATIPFTIKVDVSGIQSSGVTVSASVPASSLALQTSQGGSVTTSGNANGNPITVVTGSSGYATLSGTPTFMQTVISTNSAGQQQFNNIATYSVTITAGNSPLTLDLPNSSMPAFSSQSNSVVIYKNGVSDNANLANYGIITSFSQPSNTTLNSSGNFFTIAAHQTVTIPVTYNFTLTNPGSSVYGLSLLGVNTNNNSAFLPLSGNTCAGACGSNGNPTQPGNPITPVNNGSTMTASLIDDSSNHAGPFGVFGPGTGTDWHWQLIINSPTGGTINSLAIQDNNNYDTWQTLSSVSYPLVVFQNGRQLNSAYGQNISVPAGVTTFDLYGQVGTPNFNQGGFITAIFSDGTKIASNIAASSIIAPTPITTPVTTPTCPTGWTCTVTVPVTTPVQNLTPVLNSFSPTSAAVDSTLNIYGSNFVSGSSLVKFELNGRVAENVSPNSVSSNGTQISVIIPSDLAPGNYIIQIENIGNGTTALSNSLFNLTVTALTSQPTNQPPVINAVTAPTTLNVGQTGTWNISATDPQNGSLTYSVNWGDNSSNPTPQILSHNVQNTTFTHSYASAGNYTVSFTVSDSAGLTNSSSATIQVNNLPVPITTPVTAPTSTAPVVATPTTPTVPTIPAGSIVAINHSQNPATAQGLIYVYWPNIGSGYTYTVSASPAYSGSVETTTGTGINMGCYAGGCFNGGGPFPGNGPYTFTVTATNGNGTITLGTSNAESVSPTTSTTANAWNAITNFFKQL